MSSTVPLRFDHRTRCPVCGSTRGDRIIDLAFDDGEIATYITSFYEDTIAPARLAGGRYALVRCDDCGLLFQRDVLDAAGLSELYSGFSAGSLESAQRRRGLAERRLYSHQVEQAIKFFDLAPTDLEVLDFGSGWELWLDMAAAYGCRTTGVEIDRARLEQRSANSRHRMLGIDELPSASFHFVNAEQVFEHLADPAASIRQLVTSLRPGGLMRISVPDGSRVPELLTDPDWSASKGTPSSLNAVAPLEHINCFDHGALTTLGTSVGGMRVFRYPWRQSLDRFERLRFAIDGVVQNVRPRRGTAMIFQRRR